MELKIVWLAILLLLYWAYCVFHGVKGAVQAHTTQSYFLADRGLSPNTFTLASTAMSLTAVFVVGHAGMIYRAGIPYSLLSLCVIAMALMGTLFTKRQWMLSKRFGYVTPGEMLAHYFESNLIRALVVLVALLFAIPFFGIQLAIGGWFLEILSDGAISISAGASLTALVIAVYAALGGLRGLAEIDAIHGVLILLVVVALGLITLHYAGGVETLNLTVQSFAQFKPDYIHLASGSQAFASSDSGGEIIWSGTLLLSIVIAFAGIQLTPGFSLMGFSSETTDAFVKQQLIVFAIIAGVVLIVFSTMQGVAGHLLGADLRLTHVQPALVNALMAEGLHGKDLMQLAGEQDMLIPQLLLVVQNSVPWLAVILLLGVLAGIHAGAVFVFAASAVVVRDGIAPFVKKKLDYRQQRVYTRICVFVLIAGALMFSNREHGSLIVTTALAGAYALQLLPALLAVCWWPWLTRPGCVTGMVIGVIAVTVTDPTGVEWFGIGAWNGWPWSIHAAVWGVACNMIIAILISAVSRNKVQKAHRLVFHRFLREHAGLSQSKKSLRILAWTMVLSWFYFAVGPGAVIGNQLWQIPANYPVWLSGLPSLWLWQWFCWAGGVYMIWFLACRMELSTAPHRKVIPLCEDIRELN
ncbi:MAG: hypothetical protein OER96_12795 [Gammaproteobacteria bacterium]|nr:hypothetical protein [Gammaproteobacteria bacterium]